LVGSGAGGDEEDDDGEKEIRTLLGLPRHLCSQLS
jgi:hypothetical protein